jgi:hypothetical protein
MKTEVENLNYLGMIPQKLQLKRYQKVLPSSLVPCQMIERPKLNNLNQYSERSMTIIFGSEAVQGVRESYEIVHELSAFSQYCIYSIRHEVVM